MDRGNSGFEAALTALRALGGYFVFRDETGESFVLQREEDWRRGQEVASEVQLSFVQAVAQSRSAQAANDDDTAEDVLSRINREIAEYHLQQAEETELAAEEVDDLAAEAAAADVVEVVTDGKRVRFEPLRGDLPPELQD